MKKLIGTGVALITPFKADLSIDHEALSAIVEYNISNGIDYLVISGTTGESVTISKQEKKAIVETICATNQGRVPLVIGIGGNDTAAVVEELKITDLSSFSAVLSVSPYYSKPTQEGLYQHFKAVSKASSIPIILYNVPGRTSKNLEVQTTLRLANDFENIIGIKEAGNNTQQYLELLKNKPADFLIISGDDDLALGIVLAGGSGVISVIGQAYPKTFSEMINLGLSGDAKSAFKNHFKLIDITSHIFEENNPAGIKAVLSEMKLCNNYVRLPLVPASKNLQLKIKQFVSDFK